MQKHLFNLPLFVLQLVCHTKNRHIAVSTRFPQQCTNIQNKTQRFLVFFAMQNEFDQNDQSVILISKPYEVEFDEKFDIMSRGISGKVTRIIDAETLEIQKIDGTSMIIELALVDTNMSISILNDMTGKLIQPIDLVTSTCSIGTFVQFVQDSDQPTGFHSKGIGLVYCHDKLLNELLLRTDQAKIPYESCKVSEFADEIWAKEHGC